MSKSKKEKISLEDASATLNGVDDIPEVNENNLVPESIKEAVSEQKETVFIYCGPSSNSISRYTSYKNGYPVHLKEDFEKCPVLKSLFVEPEHFSEFEKNVAEKGTVENICFEEVKKYFSKAVR